MPWRLDCLGPPISLHCNPSVKKYFCLSLRNIFVCLYLNVHNETNSYELAGVSLTYLYKVYVVLIFHNRFCQLNMKFRLRMHRQIVGFVVAIMFARFLDDALARTAELPASVCCLSSRFGRLPPCHSQ
jgi:hypothetical protein